EIAPGGEGPLGDGQAVAHLDLAVLGVVADGFAGGRVDRSHGRRQPGDSMAEREGFEPSVRVYPGQLLSRQPCSATPAPLRGPAGSHILEAPDPGVKNGSGR